MKPSRTYTLAKMAIGALLFLALLLAGVALADRDAAALLVEPFGALATAIAAAAGTGAGALGLRDYGSGGLTSSQADDVIRARAAASEPAIPLDPALAER